MKVFPSARPSLTQADVKVDPKADLTKARKIALYGTFSWTGQLSQRHFDHCAALRKAGYFVIACRAAERHGKASNAVTIGDVDILKPNIGYDFGSWWFGLQWLKDAADCRVSEYDAICVTNDSYFGSLENGLFADLDGLEDGLKGLTENLQLRPHLQSYLLVATGDYLSEGHFEAFLNAYDFPEKKMDIVHKWEIGFSKDVEKLGFERRALLSHVPSLDHWVATLPSQIDRECEARTILGLDAERNKVAQAFENTLRGMIDNHHVLPYQVFWQSSLSTKYKIFKREMVEKAVYFSPNPYTFFQDLAVSDTYFQVIDAFNVERWEGPTPNETVTMSVLKQYRSQSGLPMTKEN
ncbi:MAG: rhamnan synthesis F family protein [Pseudomonadota bacterium]